jgi:acyl-CoA thioester hydrolase
MQNLKSFETRWSDLDANRHVANIAYISFMVERRVTYLAENGFGQQKLVEYNLGPVVLSEEIHYRKEVLPGERVYVDIELVGHSEDFRFFKFSHTLFNSVGKMSAYSELLFAWIDLTTRKIKVPPPDLLETLLALPKSGNFATITKEDIRKPHIPHKELDLG